MTEAHVFDLLPAYALGALDADDLLKVAQHLAGCPLCREALSAFNETAGRLALSAPLLTPPVDLRARVVARVMASERGWVGEQRAAKATGPHARETQAVIIPPLVSALPAHHQPVEQVQRQPIRNRSGWTAWLRSLLNGQAGLAFGIGALALILLLALSNLLLWQRINNLQASAPGFNAPDADMQIVRLTGTADAPQATGYLMVFKGDPYGSLTVDHAPPLEMGKQYQIWLIHDGKRTSGGVFSVTDAGYGTLQINADKPLDQYQSFGITIEPEGGSPGPTGKKVMGGGI